MLKLIHLSENGDVIASIEINQYSNPNITLATVLMTSDWELKPGDSIKIEEIKGE